MTVIYAFFNLYIFEGSLDIGTPHVTPCWDPRSHWSTMRQFFSTISVDFYKLTHY